MATLPNTGVLVGFIEFAALILIAQVAMFKITIDVLDDVTWSERIHRIRLLGMSSALVGFIVYVLGIAFTIFAVANVYSRSQASIPLIGEPTLIPIQTQYFLAVFFLSVGTLATMGILGGVLVYSYYLKTKEDERRSYWGDRP